MPDVTPYPKTAQLARGERRYRRRVASPKQWQSILEAKSGPCRVCSSAGPVQFHHIVPRGLGGDDLADNICPVCADCHRCITIRMPHMCEKLCASLTDGEYAYAVGKLGEQVWERVYGISYGRA